jgi:protein SCO1/2
MKRKTALLNIASLIITIAIVTGCSSAFHGGVINPAEPAADIQMPDQNGNDFQLSAQRGKVVLVFFGFLNCVDECPLTMAHLSQAMKTLGDRAQDVQVVMVSTDPVRDSSKAMKEYLSNFDPTFLGITGTQDKLQPIWDDYGVVVEDGGETHSAYTYVIDQNGDLRLTFDPEMTSDDIASDLEKLLTTQ